MCNKKIFYKSKTHALNSIKNKKDRNCRLFLNQKGGVRGIWKKGVNVLTNICKYVTIE